MNEVGQRPLINEFQDPVVYVRSMIDYRRSNEPNFSVHKSAEKLRRVSSSLVSLILKGKRKITLDRVEELAKLLNLNSPECYYFRSWIASLNNKENFDLDATARKHRKERNPVAYSLLNDWVNVYVKDQFQLLKVQQNPDLIFSQLRHMASAERIKRSLKFLIREGYLRRTPEGHLVVEHHVSVADKNVSSQKVRRFHKGALKLAHEALDLFPLAERLANTLIVPLNDRSYRQLMGLVEEFTENLKQFSEQNTDPGDRLYQLILNVSPIGGKPE